MKNKIRKRHIPQTSYVSAVYRISRMQSRANHTGLSSLKGS